MECELEREGDCSCCSSVQCEQGREGNCGNVVALCSVSKEGKGTVVML